MIDEDVDRGPFYVWHDEGCCDNKCDTLDEARLIADELEERYPGTVYITNADNELLRSPGRIRRR